MTVGQTIETRQAVAQGMTRRGLRQINGLPGQIGRLQHVQIAIGRILQVIIHRAKELPDGPAGVVPAFR